MIAKILAKTPTFAAVEYNTNKVDEGKGELMLVSGFGALDAMGRLMPEDYKNYLKMISARNKKITRPQFHAAISDKEKTYNKEELTAIAVRWLKAMGYGDQPYLIIFHHDTENNHVHVVSTRVNRQGAEISNSFERYRSNANINRIMRLEERPLWAYDYQFSTPAQFRMILQGANYILKDNAVIKFGRKQMEIDPQLIEKKIKNYQVNEERKTQLKAMFHKYAAQNSTRLRKEPGGYTSDFAACLKEKLNIVLVFHAAGDRGPYGYSVIDHHGKAVYKGSEIIPLDTLINIPVTKKTMKRPKQKVTAESQQYYAALLKASLYNYPELAQGLQDLGLHLIHEDGNFILGDKEANCYLDVPAILDETDCAELVKQYQLTDSIPGIFISGDADDEAIYGRKRNKKSRYDHPHR